MLERDRRWARALRAELGDRLASSPIHLATPDRLQVFAPDDVVAVQLTGRRHRLIGIRTPRAAPAPTTNSGAVCL